MTSHTICVRFNGKIGTNIFIFQFLCLNKDLQIFIMISITKSLVNIFYIVVNIFC